MRTLEGTRDSVAAAARCELARRRFLDFATFVSPEYETPPHVQFIGKHLQALIDREINKLMVILPPRHSKTLTTSRLFPAFWLGKNPTDQVILASYGATLAEGNSRAVRTLLEDERYPFETRVSPTSFAVDRWNTTAGGTVIVVGRGGGLTGHGGHLGVWDDLIKDRTEADSETTRESAWSWYTDVAKTRLMGSRAVQLFSGTLWHEDDPMGRLLNSDDAKNWTVLRLPIEAEEGDPLGRAVGEPLWPSHFGRDYIEDQKLTMSARSWSALYGCRATPADGLLFRKEWFENRFDALPRPVPSTSVERWSQPWRGAAGATYVDEVPSLELVTVQACDSAWKAGPSNDWSVIATVVFDGRDFYVVDIWRDKVEYPRLREQVVAAYWKHKPDALFVEEAASGFAIVADLRGATNIPIIGVRPDNSKVARAESVTPLYEAGRVKFPRYAPWLDALIDEHLRFPVGAHDDQVDSLCLAIRMAGAAMQRRLNALQMASQLGDSWMSR